MQWKSEVFFCLQIIHLVCHAHPRVQPRVQAASGWRTGTKGLAHSRTLNPNMMTSIVKQHHCFCGKLSSILFWLLFHFPWAPPLLLLLHIFSLLLTCTTRYYDYLESCALNAEFQYFIPRFNKNFLTLQTSPKEGDQGWWKETQRQGENRVTLRKTL